MSHRLDNSNLFVTEKQAKSLLVASQSPTNLLSSRRRGGKRDCACRSSSSLTQGASRGTGQAPICEGWASSCSEEETLDSNNEAIACEGAEHSAQTGCPICGSPYSAEEPDVPVVLTCDTSTHTFCRSCLVNYALVQEDAHAPLACPLCRAEHDVDITDLPRNDAAIPGRKRSRQIQEDELSCLSDKLKKHDNVSNLFSALRMYRNTGSS
eukprot:1330912-Rhodomonas_salina.1